MAGWFTWLTVVKLGEKTAQHLVIILLIIYLMQYTDELYKYLRLDRTAPELVMKGEAVVIHERGTPYVDAGATSPDPTARIETVGADGPTDVVGEFLVTYVAVDRSDNRSPTATRLVKVVDTIAPTLRLVGDATMHLAVGDAFEDPGAASDDPTATVAAAGLVDTSTPGIYVVSYTATDPAGNVSLPLTRDVHVVEEGTTPGGSMLLYYVAVLLVVSALVYAARRANDRRGRSEASVLD